MDEFVRARRSLIPMMILKLGNVPRSFMTTGRSSPPSSPAIGPNEGRLLDMSCCSRFPTPRPKPANPYRWTHIKLCGVMLMLLPTGIALDWLPYWGRSYDIWIIGHSSFLLVDSHTEPIKRCLYCIFFCGFSIQNQRFLTTRF